jgi:hypothetical protein
MINDINRSIHEFDQHINSDQAISQTSSNTSRSEIMSAKKSRDPTRPYASRDGGVICSRHSQWRNSTITQSSTRLIKICGGDT